MTPDRHSKGYQIREAEVLG